MAISTDDYNWAVAYKKYNEDYINGLFANFHTYDQADQEYVVQLVADLQVVNQELHIIISAYEKQQAPNVSDKYMVSDGDTLPSIANKYYDDFTRWEDIFAANNLSDIKLQVGQILSIPTEKAGLV